MRRTSTTLALVFVLASVAPHAVAQTGGSEPYKLGTFKQDGRTFVGVVLGDTRAVDLAKANADYESRNATAKKLTMPDDRSPSDLSRRAMIGTALGAAGLAVSAQAARQETRGERRGNVHQSTQFFSLPE